MRSIITSQQVRVACLEQADASSCWSTPYKTIQDGVGRNFASLGHSATHLDQTTGTLYTYGIRSDGVAGVVSIDTTQPDSNPNPFADFSEMAAGTPYRYDAVGAPMLVGDHWYAVFHQGTNANKVMCFDVSAGVACANQPYDLGFNVGTTGRSSAAIGDRLYIQTGNTLGSFDTTTLTESAGNWPVSVDTNYGAPFPLMDSAGTITGVVVPNGQNSAFDLNGNPVSTPAGMNAAIARGTYWNGPSVTIGPRVYVPSGYNTNPYIDQVGCFDYSTGASCENFPKQLTRKYLYTVNLDPQRPTGLWVNGDNGALQIETFDAYTGGPIGQGPVRLLTSQFAGDCLPEEYLSLELIAPDRSSYTDGYVEFFDGAGNPLGIPPIQIDANGVADLTGLNLNTPSGAPQFEIILNGVTGEVGDLTARLTWSGEYDGECLLPATEVSGGPPTGTDKTLTIDEDTQQTIATADFGFSDSDTVPDGLLAVTFTTVPNVGSLNFNGVPVAPGDSLSKNQLDSNQLTFDPEPDGEGTGYASFTFQVQDDGGTSNGDVDLDPSPNILTIDVNPLNDAPVIDVAASPLGYVENGLPVPIDSGALVSDIDSDDFSGGSLTVSFTANGTTNDQLGIADVGGISVAGNVVSYDAGSSPQSIGTFTGGTNGSPLVISFQSTNATVAAAQALARAITYSNTSEDPSQATLTAEFVVVDGDGGGGLTLDSTFGLNNALSNTFSNFHPQGLGFDPSTGELLFIQQNSNTIFRANQSGNILGTRTLGSITYSPSGHTTPQMRYTVSVAADASNYYVSDYTGNTGGFDLYRVPKAGGPAATISSEIAAFGGYPIDVRNALLYRTEPSTNYSYSNLNQIRVAPIGSPDSIQQTITLSGPQGIGDIAVDPTGGVVWTLDYLSNASIRKFDLATGDLLETFNVGVDGLDAGLTVADGKLFYYDWRSGAGSTLSIFNIEEAGQDTGSDARDINVTAINDDPTVSAVETSITIDEGQTASNSGSFDDFDLSDDVTITASIGTITQDSGNSGSWSWQFDSTDDLDTTVTITADDGNGGIATTTFDLEVLNVAPSNLSLSLSATSITEDGTTELSGSFDDPGTEDIHTIEIDWGDNSPLQTVTLLPGQTNFRDISHTYLDDGDSPGNGSPADDYTITITSLTDDDGGSLQGSSAALRPNVMVSGSSQRDVTTFFPTGTLFNLISGNTPNSNTQALFITRSGLTGLSAPALQTYLNNGGIIITEFYISDEVFNLAFNENVSQGSRQGDCSDHVNPAVQLNTNDPFWQDLSGITPQDPSREGCGYDVGAFPGIAPLGAWASGAVQIAYRDLGQGRLWLVDSDWQDNQSNSAPYDQSATILGYMLTHGGLAAPSVTVTVNNDVPEFDDLATDFADFYVPSSAEGVLNHGGIDFSDDGTLDVHTVTVNFGDNAPSAIQSFAVSPTGNRSFDLPAYTYVTEGTFPVTVTLSDDDSGSVTESFLVTVKLNDPPSAADGSVTTAEDTTYTFAAGDFNFADPDVGDTLQAVEINSLPASGSLYLDLNDNDANDGETLAAGDTVSIADINVGRLKFEPVSNESGSPYTVFDFRVNDGEEFSVLDYTMTVNVTPVVDAPTLTVDDAEGNEDTAIPLTFDPQLVDTDGSETLSVTVSGIPNGAVLTDGTNSFAATAASDSVVVTAWNLAAITITPPLHSDSEFGLEVTATSTEAGGSTTSLITIEPDTPFGPGNCIPFGEADSYLPFQGFIYQNIPAFSAVPGDTLAFDLGRPNDVPIQYDIELAPTTVNGGDSPAAPFVKVVSNSQTATNPVGDNLVGNYELEFTFENAFSFAGGGLIIRFSNPDGSFASDNNCTQVLVSGNASDSSGYFVKRFYRDADGLPSYDISDNSVIGAFQLGLGSQTASTSATINIQVDAVADAPTLSVNSSVITNEDTAVNLGIGSGLVDTDGSESLTVSISGAPSGATLSDGTNTVVSTGANIDVTGWTLGDITVLPPLHDDGEFQLTVTATATETAPTSSDTIVATPSADTIATIDVQVDAVADAPTLSVNSSVITNEDTAVNLGIGSGLVDTDGSESLTVSISGAPAGATLSDGTNTVVSTGAAFDVTGWTLGDITVLLPPLHDDGEFQLTVTATATETAPTSSDTIVATPSADTIATIDVQVDAVADAPTLSVNSSVITNEDTAVNLGIGSGLVDTDGSESLTVSISGAPAGATLSDGTNTVVSTGAAFDVTGWTLGDITVLPPLHDDGEFQLTVTATATETAPTSSDTTVATPSADTIATINMQVDAVADAPNLTVVDTASGTENTEIPLSITSSLVDTDGSESLLIAISGVPAGAFLNQGTDNGGGIWTLTSPELSGLTILHPDDSDFTLTVTATSSEDTPASSDPTVAVANADTVLEIEIDVTNSSPIIDATSLTNSSPDCGLTHSGDPISVSVDFSDPGFDNPAGGTSESFTLSTIDWGDGTVESYPAIAVTEVDGSPQVSTTGQVSGTHAYATGGVFTVTITVIDDDGDSDVITTEVVTTGVGVVNGTLYVIGTEGEDKVDVKLKGSDGGADQAINVKGQFDKKGLKEKFDQDFPLADYTINDIVILLCGGDDDAQVHNNIAVDALIEGGEGDDKLKGGSGNDTILGGAGDDDIKGYDGDDLLIGGDDDDKLKGGKGNDIMLGGAGDDDLKGGSDGGGDEILSGGDGNDKLKAGKGMNILIGGDGEDDIKGHGHSDGGGDLFVGGWTVHDDDPAKLVEIRGIWTSDDPYADIVTELTDFGGLLDAASVSGDGYEDKLDGDKKAADLFFAELGLDDLKGEKDDTVVIA